MSKQTPVICPLSFCQASVKEIMATRLTFEDEGPRGTMSHEQDQLVAECEDGHRVVLGLWPAGNVKFRLKT